MNSIRSKNLVLVLICLLTAGCNKNENSLPEVVDIMHWVEGKGALLETQVDTFFHVNPSPVSIYSQANFFFKGNARKVQICGDFNDWSLDSAHDMNPVEYGYWHLALPFDPKAQLEYKLVIDGKEWILDPLNAEKGRGGFGENSVLRMPEFSPPEELETNPQEVGFRKFDFMQGSSFLDTALKVHVLIPQRNGSDIPGILPSVYFQDGEDYLELGQFEKAVGNLVETGKIEPFVGIFITPFNRTELYAGKLTPKYAAFLAEELLPHIKERYPNIDSSAQRRVIFGCSYGGNVSAYTAQKYQRDFPNCAMQSPAFLANDYEVFDSFRDSEFPGLRLSYVWGTYEFLHSDIKKFSRMAEKKGISQIFRSYPEGHNWIFWAGTYDDLLIPFIPGKEN